MEHGQAQKRKCDFEKSQVLDLREVSEKSQTRDENVEPGSTTRRADRYQSGTIGEDQPFLERKDLTQDFWSN